jgi:hypothetical protein
MVNAQAAQQQAGAPTLAPALALSALTPALEAALPFLAGIVAELDASYTPVRVLGHAVWMSE